MYFLEYYGVINYINSCFTQLKTTRMATNVILDDVVIFKDNKKLNFQCILISKILWSLNACAVSIKWCKYNLLLFSYKSILKILIYFISVSQISLIFFQ